MSRRNLPPRGLLALAALTFSASAAPALLVAQQPTGNPKDTEVWTPVPKVIRPGATTAAAPSDLKNVFWL